MSRAPKDNISCGGDINNWRPVASFVKFSTKGVAPRYVDLSSTLVLNQKCIRNHSIDYSFAQYISGDQKISDAKYLKSGDILFNSTGQGTAGRCAFVKHLPSDVKVTIDSHILLLRCSSYHEAQCLSYALYSFEKTLQSFMDGSTGQAELDKVRVFNLLTKIPKDGAKQKKIAAVLSALDAKIELNNRINAELEAMAKTLYDYWFVQFDFPDAKGHPYKSSGGKMVYSKKLKREIPAGWNVEPLIDCCSVIDCLHSKKPDACFEADKYFLIQLENILDNGLLDVTAKYHVSKADYETWTSRIEIRNYDVVMTNAGRIAAFAQVPEYIVCGIGRNITAIRPNSISPSYFFLSLSGLDVQKQISANLDHGAFFKSFNVKGIKILQLIRPAEQIETVFERMAAPIIKKRQLVMNENQRLSGLRDFLLPMLMNGQVRVG